MQDLHDGINKLNHEAGGLFRCEIIKPEDVGPLTFAALGGNPDAIPRLCAVLDSEAKIKAMSRKQPAVCLCCPRSVRDPQATLAILIAASGQPSVAIASAVCNRCSAVDAEILLSRVAAAYQSVWPSLRSVEVSHPEGGHA